jgi:hypothetical protein
LSDGFAIFGPVSSLVHQLDAKAEGGEKGPKLIFCAPLATPLELFDCVATNIEIVQMWSDAVKAFLMEDRPEKTLSVRL